LAHLLYSARDREGKPVQGFVEAASTAQARQQLLAQGLADIVLHQDATVSTDPESLKGLKPEQLRELARVTLAARGKPGLLPLLGQVARGNRGWILFDLALAGWGVATGSRWLVTFGVGLAALPFAMAAWQYRHGGRYTALVKAYAVGDWQQVRALAAKLRDVSRKVQHMEFDIDVRLACIDAREGRMAEALASLEPWRARLAGDPGMFENRVAVVHALGGDRAGYVRLMDASLALTPNEPARIVDAALGHARFGDPAHAEALMRQVDPALLPPHAAGFLGWIDGLVLLRQNREGALARLGEGVAAFLQLSSQPAVWTALAFCTCDHAIALAMAGRKDDARREIAEVWPILRAHGDRPLLRMLQADGLAPTKTNS
jgi:hypothetical protein